MATRLVRCGILIERTQMSTEESLEDMVFTIVRHKKRDGFFPTWSYEELFSEGYIQAVKLTETYDPEKNKGLFSYLWTWLPVRISDGLRRFTGCTRSSPKYKELGMEKWTQRCIPHDTEAMDSMYSKHIAPEYTYDLPAGFLNRLTKAEQQTLGLFLRGVSQRNIGKSTNLTEARISQHIRSIREIASEYEI